MFMNLALKFRYGVAAMAILAVLCLAACGNGGKDGGVAGSPGSPAATASSSPAAPEPSPSPSASASSSEETAGATRAYEHELGTVEIPAQPQRVVAIQYTGAMLALGLKPVGADDEWSVYPLLQQEWAGIEDVGDPWTGLNLEKIVELQPDLIVTHVEQTYEELSKIAPTIFIPWLKYDVRGQIAAFGDILGKPDEADKWLADFDAKVASAKAQAAGLIGPDETVAIVNIRPTNQFVYGDSAMGGYVIYQALGLKAPEKIQQEVIGKKLAALEITEEAIPDYVAAADHIFLSVLAADGGKERAETIRSSGIWSNLQAAKDGNVHDLDWNTYFTTDPISTMKQLDTFIGLLKAERQ